MQNRNGTESEEQACKLKDCFVIQARLLRPAW